MPQNREYAYAFELTTVEDRICIDAGNKDYPQKDEATDGIRTLTPVYRKVSWRENQLAENQNADQEGGNNGDVPLTCQQHFVHSYLVVHVPRFSQVCFCLFRNYLVHTPRFNQVSFVII